LHGGHRVSRLLSKLGKTGADSQDAVLPRAAAGRLRITDGLFSVNAHHHHFCVAIGDHMENVFFVVKEVPMRLRVSQELTSILFYVACSDRFNYRYLGNGRSVDTASGTPAIAIAPKKKARPKTSVSQLTWSALRISHPPMAPPRALRAIENSLNGDAADLLRGVKKKSKSPSVRSLLTNQIKISAQIKNSAISIAVMPTIPCWVKELSLRLQKRTQYLNRTVLLRLGPLCPDFSMHLARMSFLEVHPSIAVSPMC
jgi:hypothetical protein